MKKRIMIAMVCALCLTMVLSYRIVTASDSDSSANLFAFAQASMTSHLLGPDYPPPPPVDWVYCESSVTAQVSNTGQWHYADYAYAVGDLVHNETDLIDQVFIMTEYLGPGNQLGFSGTLWGYTWDLVCTTHITDSWAEAYGSISSTQESVNAEEPSSIQTGADGCGGGA